MPVERGARKAFLLLSAFLILVAVRYALGHLYDAGLLGGPVETAAPPSPPEISPQVSESKNSFLPDVEVNGKAPELSDLVWMDSEPRTLAGLKGGVVLLTFWSWTCERCIDSIPWLNELQETYGGEGLTVIALHGPSLPTDKNGEKVREVMGEHGIKYLVALDNDYKNWNNYKVTFTPTRFLIDKGGRIRHIAIGDWGFEETEEVLTALLKEQPR